MEGQRRPEPMYYMHIVTMSIQDHAEHTLTSCLHVRDGRGELSSLGEKDPAVLLHAERLFVSLWCAFERIRVDVLRDLESQLLIVRLSCIGTNLVDELFLRVVWERPGSHRDGLPSILCLFRSSPI